MSAAPELVRRSWRRAVPPPQHALSWQCGGPSTSTSYACVPTPWKGADALVLRARDIVPTDVLDAVRTLLPRLSYDRDEDSVDGKPAFQVQFVRDGRFVHRQLGAMLEETLTTRLLPLLRRSRLLEGKAADLVLCEALLRVYDEGHRRVHPAHYDADALCTAMFEVDAADDAPPAFFVQAGAHVSSRAPVALGRGDVVAHSFDVQHGVDVRHGRRCSVIMWFTDSASSCVSKARPWYEAGAAAGEAVALYNRAKDLSESDPQQSHTLMRAAARDGHFVAQNDLGAWHLERYLDGQLDGMQQRDALDEAEQWLRASAEAGFWRAEDNMSIVCEARGREADALEWLTRAATQRADPEQSFKLGLHYWQGTWGAAADEQIARAWMREAAQMGHPVAQLAMGELASTRAEAWSWLRCAAEQRHMDVHMAMGQSARLPPGSRLDRLRRLAAGSDAADDIIAVEMPTRTHGVVTTGERPRARRRERARGGRGTGVGRSAQASARDAGRRTARPRRTGRGGSAVPRSKI